MNARIRAITMWAEGQSFDLDKADIDGHNRLVSFWHHRETAINFRAVKRGIRRFEKSGDPPDVSLKRTVDIPEGVGTEEWTIRWYGAYECKRTTPRYECTTANFREGEQLTEEEMTDFI